MTRQYKLLGLFFIRRLLHIESQPSPFLDGTKNTGTFFSLTSLGPMHAALSLSSPEAIELSRVTFNEDKEDNYVFTHRLFFAFLDEIKKLQF